MRTVIVLLGGPGAGKGTQAERLSGSLNIPHISTGQLLRAEVSACTLLGLRAKATMQTGGLVSDDLVNELVENSGKTRDALGPCQPATLYEDAYLSAQKFHRLRQIRLAAASFLVVPTRQPQKRRDD